MRSRSYTDEQVILAVKSSTSIRQVLSKLGLKEAGGNYRSIRCLIGKLGVDMKHFTGKGWLRGKKPGPRRPIEDYLSNKQSILSHKLRLRLIKDGFFLNECCECRLSMWMNKPIPLELEHVDGNHQNNNLSNLKILCPNCHALTSTYRGKNKKVSKAGLEPARPYRQ